MVSATCTMACCTLRAMFVQSREDRLSSLPKNIWIPTAGDSLRLLATVTSYAERAQVCYSLFMSRSNVSRRDIRCVRASDMQATWNTRSRDLWITLRRISRCFPCACRLTRTHAYGLWIRNCSCVYKQRSVHTWADSSNVQNPGDSIGGLEGNPALVLRKNTNLRDTLWLLCLSARFSK